MLNDIWSQHSFGFMLYIFLNLGGKDSCKGDSGGPLIAWKDKQAFLIGVVSRGAGCARHNEAGVYARVKMHLEWIKKYADSGQC